MFSSEASDDFTNIAMSNIKRNNLNNKVTLIKSMSTDVKVKSEIKQHKKRNKNKRRQKVNYLTMRIA